MNFLGADSHAKPYDGLKPFSIYFCQIPGAAGLSWLKFYGVMTSVVSGLTFIHSEAFGSFVASHVEVIDTLLAGQNRRTKSRMVHRDITPSNILVRSPETGECVIADLGFGLIEHDVKQAVWEPILFFLF